MNIRECTAYQCEVKFEDVTLQCEGLNVRIDDSFGFTTMKLSKPPTIGYLWDLAESIANKDHYLSIVEQ